jgi:DNA ligase-1
MNKKVIRLEKISETGKKVFWEARIVGSMVDYEWGQIGGKTQVENRVFLEGKNIGKANETTPAEQCQFEAERKARKKVEDGYSIVKGSLETVSKTVVESDTSVPKPMLAKRFQDQEKQVKKWGPIILAQRKLNGNRCLANIKTNKLYSRKRKEITSIPGLAEAVSRACKKLRDMGIEWVDGELYSHELTFNQIQSVVRQKNQIDENADTIDFKIYDYISSDCGQERCNNIAKLVKGPRVEITNTVLIAFDDIQEWHDKFHAEGYEGIILRNPSAPYEQKRSGSLIKYKNFIDAEFKVVGWSAEKNDSSKMGAAILEMSDGQTFKATPSMSDVEKAAIWKNRKEYIGKMATVEFQEYDKVTGIPLFGTLKGFRDESDLDDED